MHYGYWGNKKYEAIEKNYYHIRVGSIVVDKDNWNYEITAVNSSLEQAIINGQIHSFHKILADFEFLD